MACHERAYHCAMILFTSKNINSLVHLRAIHKHDSMVTVQGGASLKVFFNSLINSVHLLM